MPSSTDELRKQFGFGKKLKGGGYDDGIANAEKIIIDAGGRVEGGWIKWLKTEGIPSNVSNAMDFLCEEWDYGFQVIEPES